MKISFQLIVLSHLLLSGVAIAATPCLLSGSADLRTQPEVIRRGADLVSIVDCSEIGVLQGKARLFMRRPSGQGFYVNLEPGERLANKMGDTSSSSYFTRFRNMAASMAGGGVATHTGIKRDISGGRVEGFPYANVMPWRASVKFNFLNTLNVISSFELVDSEGKRLYQANELKGAFSLPGGLLQSDKEYHWSAIVEGKPLKGRFRTLKASMDAELQADLSNIETDPALQNSEKMALAAMAFDRFNLAFDRDRTLAEISAPPKNE